MAFDYRGLTLIPNQGGVGGLAMYSSTEDGDDLGTLKGAAFWSTDLSSLENAQNLRARTALESYVRNQRAQDKNGVTMILLGGTTNANGEGAQEVVIAKLDANDERVVIGAVADGIIT